MTDSKRIDRKDAQVLGTLTASVSMALDGLSDVNAPSPSDTQVLSWNAATSRWVAAAASGGTPTVITVGDESSDTSCFPAFFTAATGDLAPKTDASALTYNAGTGALGATTFVGALTGNADTATSATTATNISPTDESSDTTCFPVFATAATGAQVPHTDASYLTYNANTGAMGATRFNSLAEAQVLTTAADTTTTLDGTYASDLLITGTAVMQVYNLGTATGYANGKRYTFYNGTPEFVGVLNTDASVWHRVPPRAKCVCILADNSTASGVWFSEVCDSRDPAAGLNQFTDWMGISATTAMYFDFGWVGVVSGTGATQGTAGGTNYSKSGRQGTLFQYAGTTTTGYAQVYTPNGALAYIGTGCRAFETSQSIYQLSTSGDEFIVRHGIGNNLTGGAHTSGVYFVYDRATNGDFWAIKNINGSGNATTVTAVAPVVSTSGANWQRLRLEVDSAAARSDFWIDRVKVSGTGGLSTYLPLTSTAIKIGSQSMTKTAGTNAVAFSFIDYTWLQSYPSALR